MTTNSKLTPEAIDRLKALAGGEAMTAAKDNPILLQLKARGLAESQDMGRGIPHARWTITAKGLAHKSLKAG